MLLNKEKVLNVLPHREPFLFVDSINSISKPDWTFGDTPLTKKQLVGTEIIGSYFVSPGLEILKGHFPGHPVLPGVIQVEIMAQVSTFIVAATKENLLNIGDLNIALISVNNAKFRNPVLPSMDLKIHATCSRLRGNISCFACKVLHEEKVMSEADIIASIQI